MYSLSVTTRGSTRAELGGSSRAVSDSAARVPALRGPYKYAGTFTDSFGRNVGLHVLHIAERM